MFKEGSVLPGRRLVLKLLVLFTYCAFQNAYPCLRAQPGSQASELSEVSLPKTTVWAGLDGKPLPFTSHEEIKEFLRTAKVVSKHDVDVGVTNPWRLVLERDGVKAQGIFRHVNLYKERWVDPKRGARLRWRDYCVYECAAYELSRLLGLDFIPPVVRRRIDKTDGTLQLWVEDALMEKDREEESILPPNSLKFVLQVQVMKIFDDLIYNDDRNSGNMLYDKTWKLWLIDHTRAFRLFEELPGISQLQRCERGLWENLQNLDDELIKERLKGSLNGLEIKGLLKRRVLLVEHYRARIAEKGEAGILFTVP